MWRTWRPASTGCCRYYIQADVIYLPYVLTDCMFLVFVFSWNELLFSLFYPSGPEDCDAALSGPHVPPQRPCADRALSAVWSHSPPRLPLVRVSLMIQTTHFYPEIFNSSVNRGQHFFVFFSSLGESIAANNAYRQREAELSVKRVAVQEVPPLRTNTSTLDSSSVHSKSVHSLVEKIQTGLEVECARVFLCDCWNVNISMGEANSCDQNIRPRWSIFFFHSNRFDLRVICFYGLILLKPLKF